MERGSGLQRGAGLARGGRLAQRSPAMTAKYVDRRKLVGQMLAAFPVCQLQVRCRGAASVDLHERLKRSRGGNILDAAQSHAITVCRACHDWTEERTGDAQRAQALLPSWHRCPPVGPC